MPAGSAQPRPADAPLRETFIETPRLRFAALEAGAAGAPLVLCLHGFPDSAWTWRHLLPALAQRGYHGVAPFLRGYHPTELPSAGFGLGDLAADLIALEDTLRGPGRSVMIGHDWGAAVLYTALARDPQRWACAVAASVPPAGAASIDSISPAQLRRSWYSLLFQLPDADVPLQIAAADDMALVESLWRDWSPGLDAAEDVSRAKDALRPPGHLRAAIAYYRETPTRAPTQRTSSAERKPQSDWGVPLLYLHGAKDGCIGFDAVEGLRSTFAPAVQVEVLQTAGHFIQLEQPDEVNDLVLEFVSRYA